MRDRPFLSIDLYSISQLLDTGAFISPRSYSCRPNLLTTNIISLPKSRCSPKTARSSGLDKKTLSTCISMIESGANPENLAVSLWCAFYFVDDKMYALGGWWWCRRHDCWRDRVDDERKAEKRTEHTILYPHNRVYHSVNTMF
jgi:hypothetical protein